MYKNKKQNKNNPAFTIVELLIVIVIIGILAAITIVSYTNITKKANESSIQADLANAKKQIELYKVIHGQYPTGLDQSTGCLTGNIAPSPDTNYCLKKSNSTATYTMSNADGTIYTLKLDNGTLAYKITESTGPTSTTTTPIAESFVKTWGGSGSDVGYSLIQTSDGGYVITGYTSSYGAGSNDIFLVKYDAFGNIAWNKTWGGTGADVGRNVVQASDGGYIVVGYASGYGAGSTDVFLAKFDISGSLVWNKTLGSTGSDTGIGLINTSDGGFAITGYFQIFGAGREDMFLVKCDSLGNIVWNKTWGGVNSEVGYSLIQTSDNGYAVTGYTASYGAGSNDVFLSKYDASGNLVWNKTWGGAGSDLGLGLINSSDGGYIVTGYTASYGAGSDDIFLIKYDASGNLVWNKTWGGAGSDTGFRLIKSIDGGYVVTGYTNSYGAGSVDLSLVKFDSTGAVVWNRSLGGGSDEYGYGIIQDIDSRFVVTGQIGSYGAGVQDVLFAKYNSTGSITNCASPMCQTPTATITTPSATVTSPTATITSPSATVTTPSATITTPTATQTTVVAAP